MLKSPWIKALVWIACLAPFAELVWLIAHNDVTANPAKFIEHFTGDWTLNLIVATLAITPLRKLLGLPDLIRFRRLIGLFAFFYVCLHFTTYLWFDQNFDFPAIWKDIAKRPYITVGFTGFCLLIPLAVTSTRGWIRRMGGKKWSRLHRLIYVTAVCGVIHYYWLVKSDVRMPLFYAALVGALLVYRVIMKLKTAKRAVAGVAASFTLFCVGQPARASQPADAPPAPPIGIANFHQVDPGVYRGAQPSAAGYQALAHLGVKTVLDLRNQGDSQARERKLVEAAGMKYVGLTFGQFSAPTSEEVRTALDLLESQSATPVFVHCRRGKDRTGTVVACYRIERNGWKNDKALAEARQNGMSWLETGMQRFIVGYRPTLPAPVAVSAQQPR
jgi:sulfoxide reductase heme-binding subunit YedZ